MKSITRMLFAVLLGMAAAVALADDMKASDDKMMDDGMSSKGAMADDMKKDDMADGMQHSSKDGGMDDMKKDKMDAMPMEDDTMDKDTME